MNKMLLVELTANRILFIRVYLCQVGSQLVSSSSHHFTQRCLWMSSMIRVCLSWLSSPRFIQLSQSLTNNFLSVNYLKLPSYLSDQWAQPGRRCQNAEKNSYLRNTRQRPRNRSGASRETLFIHPYAKRTSGFICPASLRFKNLHHRE